MNFGILQGRIARSAPTTAQVGHYGHSDQYICIVLKSDANESTNVPYKGEKMTATTVSKAIMLANDTKIDVPQFRSQIGL